MVIGGVGGVGGMGGTGGGGQEEVGHHYSAQRGRAQSAQLLPAI